MKKGAAILLALLGLLLLVAGGRLTRLRPRWFEPSSNLPPPVSDCSWGSVHASAWVDANANGKREEGELPLANVRFRFADVFSQEAWEKVSDDRGWAQLAGGLGPCPQPKPQFEVSALTPAGYEPTTPLRVPIREGASSFGFRRLN
jgi:hypothetical protein